MSEVRGSSDGVQQEGGTRAPAAGARDLHPPHTAGRGAGGTFPERESSHKQGLLGNRGVTFTLDFEQC